MHGQNLTNEKEIETLKRKTKGSNTTCSTNTWVNTYKAWAKERGKILKKYNPTELNKVLSEFYPELRKKDGSNYEPECLRVMRAGSDRYLRSKNYPVSLLKDEKFNESNVILEKIGRALRDIGMGNRPNRSMPFNCDQLRISTPMANTVRATTTVSNLDRAINS